MWQLAFVAAAATGTWFHSKHLLDLLCKRTSHSSSVSLPHHEEDPQQHHHSHDPEESRTSILISSPDVSALPVLTDFGETKATQNDGGVSENGVFRFCSLSSCKTQTGVETVSTGLKKKVRFGINKCKTSSAMDSKQKVTKTKQSQKKLPAEKNHESAGSKPLFAADGSFIQWGIGAGIMFMASAAKAETNKLSAALEETTELVQELKTELRIRRALRNVEQVSNSSPNSACMERISVGTEKTPKTPINIYGPADLTGASFRAPLPGDDGECGRSDVTEDRVQQVLEMDELEAELESELEKIPWSISQHERGNTELSKVDQPLEHVITKAGEREVYGAPEINSHHGSKEGIVSSVELEQKLQHLLIQQQEREIIDLKAQLQSTRTTLRTTRTQLQSLKSHVRRRLTEFSLQTSSDDEEGHRDNVEEEKCNGGSVNSASFPIEVGSAIQMPVVGTKRAFNVGSCSCCQSGDSVSGFS